jgi:hypothetical protein
MRVLEAKQIAAVSGGAESNPLITVPLAVLSPVFTLFDVVLSLPALLAFRR